MDGSFAHDLIMISWDIIFFTFQLQAIFIKSVIKFKTIIQIAFEFFPTCKIQKQANRLLRPLRFLAIKILVGLDIYEFTETSIVVFQMRLLKGFGQIVNAIGW